MPTDSLPYLTPDEGGLRAVFKARWEDFEVREVPRLEPEGRGDHLWMEVEKAGLTTPRAASDLARALGVKPSSVGYAGLKDARAIARQWMSVEHVEPERALSLEIPRIRVLRAERHPRKLRRGWHEGNRFLIRLRPPPEDGTGGTGGTGWTGGIGGTGDGGEAEAGAEECGRAGSGGEGGVGSVWRDPEAAAERVRSVLAALAGAGVPNYYGPQRFGTRGDTWRVGRALAREEWAEAAALIAGRPLREDDPAVDPSVGIHPDRDDILRARELFDAGRYGEAAGRWPRGYGQCARLAEAMQRTGGDAARSIPVVGKRMLRLYASAYQSWLFNAVLAERLRRGLLDRFLRGDLAWKHDTEALFEVEDPEGETSRIASFGVSPTGPLVGRRMREPTGAAAELERRVLEGAGLRPEALESAAMRPLTGRRRPVRFRVSGARVESGDDDRGPFLALRFQLPPGCYATSVLREIGKGGIVEAASSGAG